MSWDTGVDAKHVRDSMTALWDRVRLGKKDVEETVSQQAVVLRQEVGRII